MRQTIAMRKIRRPSVMEMTTLDIEVSILSIPKSDEAVPRDLFLQSNLASREHSNRDAVANSSNSMHKHTEPERDKRLPKHASLPHDYGILYSDRRSAYHKHDREVFVGHRIVAVAVLVEDWPGKNKSCEDAELDRFV
jgi:hypothetical protein